MEGSKAPILTAEGEKAPVLCEVKQGVVEGSGAPILTPQARKLPSFAKRSREPGRERSPARNGPG
ncbi:hypothetical protein CXK86_02100 [Paenibacillus sp. BGI2013]|nr:hypothetical protein CXK86_02100 [Paenibacillus sp. BGI2013]